MKPLSVDPYPVLRPLKFGKLDKGRASQELGP
jgi:hypothetical protein